MDESNSDQNTSEVKSELNLKQANSELDMLSERKEESKVWLNDS